jgi:hypothetical protein
MQLIARPEHVNHMLSAGLRAADVAEIEAASGLTPEVALSQSLTASTKAWVIVNRQGFAYAMYGVAPWPGVPTLGIPWFVATDEQARNKREFLSGTRYYVEQMGEGFMYLVNYTDCRHTESHRWLQFAGFKFDRFEPHFGAARLPFLRFSKEA